MGGWGGHFVFCFVVVMMVVMGRNESGWMGG